MLDPSLALLAAVVVPVIFYICGMGALDRLLYPATSLAVACYLYSKRSPWYAGFCVWLFCATPLVRRLADEQAGWDPSNPILLAPYLGCAFTVISLLRFRSRPAATIAPFAMVLACVSYGFLLAMFNGRVISGAVDAMKWGVGPLFAIHLLSYPDERQELHRAVVISFLVAAPAMAAYGVAQYVSPQSWDRDWMVGVASLGMNSIGKPIAFELRVFSTMNSPGSFAIVLTTAILIGLQQARPLVMIPAVLAMVIGLLLSQYRAIWAGTLLGAVCLLASGSATAKLRVLLAAVSLVLAAGSASVVPEIRNTIIDRLKTLDQLASDASGEDRMHQYDRFLNESSGALIAGEGLAITGASRRLDHRDTIIIDSGIIETFSAFGIFGGTVFIIGVLRAVGLTFTTLARRCPETPLYRAIVVATFSQLPFGSVHVGESGFGAWLFVGLAASAAADMARASHGPVEPIQLHG